METVAVAMTDTASRSMTTTDTGPEVGSVPLRTPFESIESPEPVVTIDQANGSVPPAAAIGVE
jgi:hypothetical protein